MQQTDSVGRKKKHNSGISHQPWPDFFLLPSSLCPSWLRGEVFSLAVRWFSLLYVASLQSESSQCWKNAPEREREWRNVQLVCLRAQQSESKNVCLFRIVTPAPLYRENSAYLFSLSKKATPSYCSTQAYYSTCLSHFVGLGVSMHSSSTHPSSPGKIHSSLPCPLPTQALEERWELHATFYTKYLKLQMCWFIVLLCVFIVWMKYM